jgi:NhaP-type Na+/H+ or K+/H+ antiporter
VIVLSGLLGLLAFARTLRRFEKRHFWSFLVLLTAILGFAWVLYMAGNRWGGWLGRR